MRSLTVPLLLGLSVGSAAIMGWSPSAVAQYGGGNNYGGGINPGWWIQGYGPGNYNLNSLLFGPYAFTGASGCLFAPGTASSAPSPGNTTPAPGAGFTATGSSTTPTTPIIPATSFSSSSSVEGIRTFNGDGTGSVQGTEAGFVGRPTPNGTASTCTTDPTQCGPYPNFPPSAESRTFSYQFTYTVMPDGTWTSEMVPGTYKATFVTGPRTGQTLTTTIPEFTGLIGRHARTLTAANLTPTVEVWIYSNGDVYPAICQRSRTLTIMNSWEVQGNP